MRMDSRIPFMGVVPDYVNALAMGQGAAMQRNEGARQNALAQLYQAQGPGIIAGEQGAVNALAAIDPGAALGVMDTRQGMDARSLGMDATRQNMDLQMREWAASMDDRERAQRLQEGQQMMAQFIRADTPEAWSALMVQLGKPDVPFEQRGQMINNMREPMDLLAMYDAQNAPRDTTFIVSGENEYGLDPRGQYNVTAGPGGVQAAPIGSIPAGDTRPSAAEEEIARFMEIPNPNTGLPFTRQEAIEVAQLYAISRDPVTGNVVVVNRATGAPVGQPASQPATQPPPAVDVQPPPPSFDMGDDAARAAFGLRGFGANIANTVTDTLGMGQAFPGVSQAQTDFSVAAESILADMARAWDRQPPSWVLQAQNSLIPRPGSVFTGPDGAAEQLSAIRRNAEVELRSVTDRLAGEISPTVRAQLEGQQSALANGIAKLDALTARLQPGSGAAPQGTTSTGLTWRIIE
jgi:hypothetical protein